MTELLRLEGTGPSPLLQQIDLQLIAQPYVQMTFEYLARMLGFFGCHSCFLFP